MKQYLDEQQTDKLIELGFEKPKNTQYVQRAKARNLHSPFIEFGEPEFEGSYSIGELLSFLPTSWEGDDYYALTIRGSKVMYSDPYLDWIEIDWVKHEELIDNLFDACVELKEEGVL